jgi:hypothetical protein
MRLIARGHEYHKLKNWFIEAAEKIETYSKTDTLAIPDDKVKPTIASARTQPLLLHGTYHPATPKRSLVQGAFREHCRETFSLCPNPHGASMKNVDRLTIAYARAPNIGSVVRRSRLNQSPERQDLLVSTRIKEIAGRSNSAEDYQNGDFLGLDS